MLKRLSIENFKSFKGRTTLDLAGVNVFAGANSSGKSSIIQSILLLKQTLQYAQGDRPVALNGPLIKLGSYDDVRSASATENYIGLSCELIAEEPRQVFVDSASQWNVAAVRWYSARYRIQSLTFEIRFSGGSRDSTGIGEGQSITDLSQLQPQLKYSNLLSVFASESSESDSEISQTVAQLTIEPISDASLTKAVPPEGKAAGKLGYRVTEVDTTSTDEVLGNRADAQIIGATARNFLPHSIGVTYDEGKNNARKVAEILTTDSRYSWELRDVANIKIPVQIVKIVTDRLKDIVDLPFPEPADMPLETLTEMVRHARNRYRISRRQSDKLFNLIDIRQSIEDQLTELFPSKRVAEIEIPRVSSISGEYVRSFFTNSVRYLGPLRDEPKPVYPLEALINPTEVGYKGEHTAAVLDLHRDQRIRYIPSSCFGEQVSSPIQMTATLHDAVVDWLKYMGVAEEVLTQDRGNFGHVLRVRAGDAQMHDLTNVGVGVSQVLPIIVMALLAPGASLLIFEQPELHLHPKVQARLADFFLSVSLSAKQCMLETHSEYLVERLRRRIAESDDDQFAQTIKIYFTRRVEGVTTCKDVLVTKYGAVVDWPEDFFDQASEETERILQASIRKRKRESESPPGVVDIQAEA